jgi:hypothetical protein
MGHHDAVPGSQRRDRPGRDLDVPPLHLGGHRLTAPQQRIAATAITIRICPPPHPATWPDTAQAIR